MIGLRISMVSGATETKTRDVTIAEVLDAIRNGGAKIKRLIEKIRAAKRRDDQDTVDALKRRLPAAMWSGQFCNREKPVPDKLQKHSGLLCADLDSLGEHLPEIRKKLQESPYVFAVFISPTGQGLKSVLRVPADVARHAGSFRAIEKHVFDLTGIQIDQACSDVGRLCFMSFDPGVYVNENAIEIEPVPEPEKPKLPTNGVIDLSERQRIATELLGAVDWQSETSGFVQCPGKHLHTTGDNNRDCKIDFDHVPTVHCFHDHCRGMLDAINRELRSRIGKAEYQSKSEARSSSKADDDSTDLTSLSSLGVAEYPAPLDEPAYYGLAGEIVRRIAPHTEADPVAFLVQFLVAFGNIIKRKPHAVADGAWHYLNLFCVLVGETSKGRKGTALQHTLQLFTHADEDWRKNCLASGLSSGEGVIHAVRDEIREIKPVKEKGKYTGESVDVVTDTGVTDKRLMVIESEFCSPLKVMSREGNTLSPTLRQAWDTGNLRTLTKNSPARATEAHISITGHITRQELRRSLTETESANGFGNRILWVAARRSKCLPEGGGSYGVADLVTRLHSAIEFAQTAGEVHRSDSARELWARVYPKLSEGQLGLLGAITARAEAQVLRLSCIYALLDCSATVEVDHLRAALALWRYCEDSARWIFGTGTGNKNADKILAALKAAGPKGLTRVQITNEVFNRHVTKFEIDEALRLLHSLKLAVRKLEGTATRPAERWIYKAQQREVCEESNPGDGQTGDTSHSSHPPPSQNVISAESDAATERLIGDELGVGRL